MSNPPPKPSAHGERPTLRHWLILIAVAASLAITTAALTRGFRAVEPPVALFQLPSFELLDQHGRPFTAASLAGHVWLAAFVYTSCPGPCPAIIERVKEIAAETEDLEPFRFLAISVDPANDTPDRLTDYAAERGIATERWTLLTGDAPEVRALVTEGFRLAVASAADGVDLPPEAGPILHSTRIALLDGAGAVHGFYASDDATERARAVADARALLEGNSH